MKKVRKNLASGILLKALLVLVLLPPSLGIADPYPKNPSLRILHYTFRLRLNDSTDRMEGEALVQIRFLKNEVDHFNLDLDARHPLTGKGMVVSAVTCEGKNLDYSQDSAQLLVMVPAGSHASDSAIFDIHYAGVPADGLHISRNKFGERTFFGDNWPDRAHDWLPVIDHPSQKAPVDFIVTAPDYYEVVSNGRLVERSDLGNGIALTHWKEAVPIPTKVMVIGVAHFAVAYLPDAAGVPVQVWVYPGDREQGFKDFEKAENVLALYQKYLGAFPFEKCANVESTTRYGGMENASCIFYDEHQVTGNYRNEVVVAHEIAHQWFGDDVTEADWSQIWLSEGFAEFFENFYIGVTFGADSLQHTLALQKKMIFNYFHRKPAALVDTTVTDLQQLLNINSYQKGAFVLRMLEHTLGEASFWKGMRLYHRTYARGNAWTADFEHCLEQASGRNLDSFFLQWVYRPGYPDLSWSWKMESGNRQIYLYLTQQQAFSVFDISPVIALYFRGKKILLHTLEMHVRRAGYRFGVPERPDSVKLDPQQYILLQQEPSVK
jgi:aminopeptidase N